MILKLKTIWASLTCKVRELSKIPHKPLNGSVKLQDKDMKRLRKHSDNSAKNGEIFENGVFFA